MRYLSERLRDPTTYVIAIVVGTLINLYGHVLVPWLRGDGRPVDRFADELSAHPALMAFSIALAYAFPFAVGTLSGVITRRSMRRLESWAAFPNQKPDPVFRADTEGRLVEMGEMTRRVFDENAIRTAQDVLGESLWNMLRSSVVPVRAELFYSDRLGGWYLVRHAPADDGYVNVYLTETAPPERQSSAPH